MTVGEPWFLALENIGTAAFAFSEFYWPIRIDLAYLVHSPSRRLLRRCFERQLSVEIGLDLWSRRIISLLL